MTILNDGEDIKKLKAAPVVARMALSDCYSLFSEIRNDWSDPRSECRDGWATIEAASAVIDSVLPPDPSPAAGEGSKESK